MNPRMGRRVQGTTDVENRARATDRTLSDRKAPGRFSAPWRCGRQGIPVVSGPIGQVPSQLEQWLLGRAAAEACDPDYKVECMGTMILGSGSLGVYIDVQRAGDRLLTRPVLVSYETWDNLSMDYPLPRNAWSDCNPVC